MSRFDWPALLRAGVQGLGLRPWEFWDLTPAELLLMLGLEGGETHGLNRNRLAELQARFPDQTKI